MVSSKRARSFFILIASATIALFYQNCSMEAGHYDMSSMYGKACSSALMNLYQKTYYPIFRNDCSHCHSSGPGIGQFANGDLETAFKEFQGLGRATVEGNFLNPNHQPAYGTGPQNQPTVDEFRPQWEQAEAAGCGGASTHAVSTTGVTNSSPSTSFKTLNWNLNTDVLGSALKGLIQMSVSLDVRQAQDGDGNIVGYEFRNPVVKLNSGATGMYHVKGLHVFLNGGELTDVTAYTLIEADVTSTGSMNLAPGAAYALAVEPSTQASDLFSLQFDEIVDATGAPIYDPGQPTPNPAPPASSERVTYQQLMTGGSNYGVFANSCVSCHSSGNAQGGVDLTNYNQAKSIALSIQSRMNNSNNPMPPTGLLPSSDRNKVNWWIQSGEPQQ